MTASWAAHTTNDEAIARARARRRYNAMRRDMARLRQVEVVRKLAAYGIYHGVQARIAEELGVSKATISRDVRAVLRRL